MLHIQSTVLENWMVMEELHVVHWMYQLHQKESEKEWMLKLRKVFPYWLNCWLGDVFVKENTKILVGSKFPALLRKFTRVSWGHVHKLNTFLSPDVFLYKCNFYFQNKLSDSPIFSRIDLSSMKKRNLKRTTVLLNEGLNVSNSIYIQWLLMLLDIINSKILNHPL